MKLRILTLLLLLSPYLLAYSDPDYKANTEVMSALQEVLDLSSKDKLLTQYETRSKTSDNVFYTDTKYFYRWKKERLSEGDEKKIFDSLKDFQDKIATEYGIYVNGGNYSANDDPRPASNTNIPGISLRFYKGDLYYHMYVEFYHLDNVLCIATKCIFPLKPTK